MAGGRGILANVADLLKYDGWEKSQKIRKICGNQSSNSFIFLQIFGFNLVQKNLLMIVVVISSKFVGWLQFGHLHCIAYVKAGVILARNHGNM